MREFGVPALTAIPASAGLTDTVFRRAGAEPGVVVLRRRTGAGDWQHVTAAEFHAEEGAWACGLMAAGIGPGDRVALMSRTRYEWTLIDYACWGLRVPLPCPVTRPPRPSRSSGSSATHPRAPCSRRPARTRRHGSL